MTDRDLRGYGGQPPQLAWPNGARVAVSVVVNFEEGAELQVGDGDPVSERMGEVLSVVAEGTRDIGQEQIFAYGMRAGLWRMLDALDRFEQRATFFCCGRAVERAPEAAAEVARRGHELACHGWRWRPHADYATRAEERADLVRCGAVLRTAAGIPPEGFFCRGSESVWTRSLLSELGYTYSSNAFDDDMPYGDPDHPDLLVLPYALDSNDMKFFHPNGFVRAEEMVDYVSAGLNTLLEEAERGRTSIFNIGFHLRICGRPARFGAFRDTLAMLDAFGPRVWVAPRREIASAFRGAVA